MHGSGPGGREWARRLASFRVFYMLRALGTSASSTSTWRSTTTGGGFSRPVRSWCTRDEFMRLFETTTLRARALAGSSMFATGALAVLAAVASSLGRCGDDAGTPRCTTMCTFIKPPDATDRSNLDCSLVGVPCVDEQQYAAKSMPRLLQSQRVRVRWRCDRRRRHRKIEAKGHAFFKGLSRAQQPWGADWIANRLGGAGGVRNPHH